MLGVLPLLLVIAYADSKQGYKTCKGIEIEIDGGNPENYFVTETDVKNLLLDNGHDDVVGVRFDKIDLKKLENRVLSNNLVKNCQVARGLGGDLWVSVTQYKPIARLLSESGNNSLADFYVAADGAIISLSDHYTSRVMLVSGEYFKNLKRMNRNKDKDLLSLLNYIDKDDFWKAQIAQVEVSQDGEIDFYPQMGVKKIAFGQALPDEFEIKFKKLKIFYTKILPTKGIDFYSSVSVKFQNQIVCE